MNTVKYNDILDTYKRIDLYRAKYRHADFTPHAWCFHGNEAQKWTGTCGNGLLAFNGSTQLANEVEINASTYKYVSLRFSRPNSGNIHSYNVTLTYKGASTSGTKKVIVPNTGVDITAVMDMSGEANWTGTITGISFSVTSNSRRTLLMATSNTYYCEYIKFDKENVFQNVADDLTITELDLNQMRSDTETFAKQTIEWTGGDRVKQFSNLIKKTDVTEVNSKLVSLSPYNGCATCDAFQCSCNGTDYGHIPCQACNACNQYSACHSCDQTCFEEPIYFCTCNNRCYTEARSCTCDARCNQYSTCICDGACNTCYSGNQTCTQCYTTTYW